VPTFSKSPAELVARFDELAELVPHAGRKQMFGYPTCVTGGNMFMGLHEKSLILRLSEADRVQFVSTYSATLFEPMPGRPMREYVVVPPSLVNDPALADWVGKSFEYASQLPAKAAKAAKAPKSTPSKSTPSKSTPSKSTPSKSTKSTQAAAKASKKR
jgi:TfoX/Sxy family transcriptional regulator of competence genes